MVSKGVGVPIKLLHESEGHLVTVELKSGETYRGDLHAAEDNWNVQLKDVTATARVNLLRVLPSNVLNVGWTCFTSRSYLRSRKSNSVHCGSRNVEECSHVQED